MHVHGLNVWNVQWVMRGVNSIREMPMPEKSEQATLIHAAIQGRNHGIDIGGVQMWALPQIFFFQFSHRSDRKNKQARPSTNE